MWSRYPGRAPRVDVPLDDVPGQAVVQINLHRPAPTRGAGVVDVVAADDGAAPFRIEPAVDRAGVAGLEGIVMDLIALDEVVVAIKEEHGMGSVVDVVVQHPALRWFRDRSFHIVWDVGLFERDTGLGRKSAGEADCACGFEGDGRVGGSAVVGAET